MKNLETKIKQDKAPKRQWIPLYGAVDALRAYGKNEPSIVGEHFFGSMIYYATTAAMVFAIGYEILKKFQ